MRSSLRAVCSAGIALVASLACGACAASQAEEKALPLAELTQEHRRVFDHGVDFLDDPAALGGRWELEWEQALATRVRLAHFIGIVRVTTMRMHQQPNQDRSYRLRADVDQRLLGRAPGDGLSLGSHLAHEGFSTLEGKQDRILEHRFVAFVVWSPDAQGQRRAHWHLAAAADPVVKRVRAVIEEERSGEVVPGTGPRVIRHRNP